MFHVEQLQCGFGPVIIRRPPLRPACRRLPAAQVASVRLVGYNAALLIS